MKAVVQRVIKADVCVEGRAVAEIKRGLLVLFGIHEDDEYEDIRYMVHKILNLRIFEDSAQKANLAIVEAEGEILLVPQFTLISSTRKGNRPSFSHAADIEKGREFSELFYSEMKKAFPSAKYGIFRASMQVSLINDGPFTIILDSSDRHKPRRQS